MRQGGALTGLSDLHPRREAPVPADLKKIMWSGGEDFKPLLQKALVKPSKGSLAALTDLAVRDEKWVGPPHELMLYARLLLGKVIAEILL